VPRGASHSICFSDVLLAAAHAQPVELRSRRAELALEQVEPAADRRLREVQERCGAREAAAAHDRHERLDAWARASSACCLCPAK